MPRTLICLLSTHQVPNLLSIFHFRPERLLLVESDRSEKDQLASALIAAARLGGCDYTDSYDIAKVAREDSVLSVYEALKKHPVDFANSILNATGGTKPMSMAAYDYYKKNRIEKTVYVNGARPNEFVEYQATEEMVIEQCEHDLTVAQFVTVQGATLVENSAALPALDERQNILIRLIAQCSDPSLPLYETNGIEFVSHVTKRVFELERMSVAIKRMDMHPHLQEELARKVESHFSCGSITDAEIAIVNGEWITLLVAELLRANQKALGITDVQHQVKFDVQGKTDVVDVAFVRSQRLYIVDCKSDLQRGSSQEGYVNELVAIREKFGRLGAGAILVTAARSALGEDGITVRQEVTDHARALQCKLWTFSGIRELVREGIEERAVVSLFKSWLGATP